MTRRTASGSSRSPKLVESLTSENTIVTILRAAATRRVYDAPAAAPNPQFATPGSTQPDEDCRQPRRPLANGLQFAGETEPDHRSGRRAPGWPSSPCTGSDDEARYTAA